MSFKIDQHKNTGVNEELYIFRQLLIENKMKRIDFLNQLKQLTEILKQNRRQYDANETIVSKIELGILHMHELIGLYATLSKQQSATVPKQIESILQAAKSWKQLKLQQKTQLIVQQMTDFHNFIQDPHFLSSKQCSILDHRLLSQKLVQIQQNRFKITTNLYIDQSLTQFHRCVYKLSKQQYKALRILLKGHQILNHNYISSQKSLNQKQNKNQQNGYEIGDYIYQQHNHLFSLEKEDNKQSKQNQQNIGYSYPIHLPSEEQKIGIIGTKNISVKQKKIKKQRYENNKIKIAKLGQVKDEKKKPSKQNHKKNKKMKIDQIVKKQSQQYIQFGEYVGNTPFNNEIQMNELIQNHFSQKANISQEDGDDINSLDSRSDESEEAFLKKQRARIYKYAMNKKVKNGIRLFKHSSSLRWGNKKPLSQAEEAYALGRKQFVQKTTKKY